MKNTRPALRSTSGTQASRQRAQWAFLSELTSELASANGESEIVGTFTLAATRHFSTTCAVHQIVHGGTLVLTSFAHQPPEEAGRVFQSLSRLVASKLRPLQDSLRSGCAVILAPATESENSLELRHLQERRLLEAFDGRAVILVPLLVATTVIGIASFAMPADIPQPDALEVEVATVASRHLALALENARSIERERVLETRFVTLTQATHELLSMQDIESRYQRVANSLAGGLADHVIIYRVDGNHLRVVAAAHEHAPDSALLARLRDTRPLTLEAEAAILNKLRTNPPGSALWAASAPSVEPGMFASSGVVAEILQARDEVWVPIGTGDVLTAAIAAYATQRTFDRGDVEVFEEVGRRSSLAMDQAQSFARERHLTKLLQEAALPAQLLTVKGAALSSVYSPAAIDAKVGGDWYDAFRLDEHRVLLTIGDVTGHGVQASTIMSKLRHTLNAVAMYEHDPARILDAAEAVMLQRFPNGLATAFVGIYDSRDQSLVYANAGHPPPIVRSKNGSLWELDAGGGLPIGMRLTFERSVSSTARLDQASLLALYTDGLVEASRDMAEGSRRLEECLKSDALPYVRNAAAFVEAVCLDGPAPDDVAILVLMFADSIRWAFDIDDGRAARECRATFLSELRKRGAAGGVDDAEIILGELLSNARRHAPGPVDVALDFADGKAIAHVIDHGPGMISRRRRPPDLLNETGRGLWMVQELGREVRTASMPTPGTHISVVLPVDLDVSP